MDIRESILVSATPEQIWPFVADPVGHATWNEKVVHVDRESNEPVHLGEEFDMVYRMSRRDHQSRVVVAECQPPHRVRYRHHYMWKKTERTADEIYSLESEGDGVRVTQAIDLAGTGIPWIMRAIIRLLDRFGTPQGRTTMEQLKSQVETAGRV